MRRIKGIQFLSLIIWLTVVDTQTQNDRFQILYSLPITPTNSQSLIFKNSLNMKYTKIKENILVYVSKFLRSRFSINLRLYKNSQRPQCFQELPNVWYMPIKIVAKSRLFLMKYVTKKHHIRRHDLQSISFLGVFQSPEVYFTIRVIILNIL